MNDSKVISELHNLVDALAKACLLSMMPATLWIISGVSNYFPYFQLAARPGSPESLQQLIEIAKNPANAGNLSPLAVGKEEIARTPRDKKVLRYFFSSTLLVFDLLIIFSTSDFFLVAGTDHCSWNKQGRIQCDRIGGF